MSFLQIHKTNLQRLHNNGCFSMMKPFRMIVAAIFVTICASCAPKQQNSDRTMTAADSVRYYMDKSRNMEGGEAVDYAIIADQQHRIFRSSRKKLYNDA